MTRSRASTAAAAAADAAATTQSTPAVADASPRARGHRRQWTHSQLDGSKELRLHRSPVAPEAAITEEDTDAAEEKKQPEEEKKEANSTPAPAPRSRRRTATPAAVAAPKAAAAASRTSGAAAKKGREQRQLFTKPDTVDEDEEEEEEEAEAEEEETEEQPQVAASSSSAAAAAPAAADEDEDEGMEPADFSGHTEQSAMEQKEEASEDEEEDDDDDEEEQEEGQDEDEDDDAFVAEMADWAAAELSRRLQAPPAAAAAAAASSSSSAAAAAASSSKARPASSSSSSSRAAQSSTSDLNSLFVPRMEGGTHAATAQAVPHGFQRKAGVLLLTDSALSDALAADRTSNHAPSAMAAPDMMAALGARSAGKNLPSSNPLQASKQSVKESGAAPNAGKDWFNLSRPSVLTTEMKTDLKMLSLRAYLDPKKFFKKSSKSSRKKIVPTFFQMGTVIAGAHEFYSSRLTNSERQDHFADEFIDPSLNRGAVKKTKNYLKRKVMEVQIARTPVSTKKYSNKNKARLEDAARRPGSSNKGGAGGGKKQRR